MKVGGQQNFTTGIQQRELDGIVGEFYWSTEIDIQATEEAGRPIERKVPMFKYKQIGDKLSETHVPATEGIVYNRQSGDRISAAQLWQDEYQGFLKGEGEAGSGTPLAAAGIPGSWVKNLEGQGIRFCEQLLKTPDGAIAKLGMGARQVRDQVKDYMDRLEGSVDVLAMQRELEALKAQLAQKDATAPVAEDDTIRKALADLDDDALKIYIKENGGEVPRGRASRDTLMSTAVDLAKRIKDAA